MKNQITVKAIEIAAKITWDLKMAHEAIRLNREVLSRAEWELRKTSKNLSDIEIWAHECWSYGDLIKRDVEKAKAALREWNQICLVLAVTPEQLFEALNGDVEFTEKSEKQMRGYLGLADKA